MTKEEAQAEIEGLEKAGHRIAFDYLHGRVMKVDIGGDTLYPRLFDRDNGNGAAARALAPLLKKMVA